MSCLRCLSKTLQIHYKFYSQKNVLIVPLSRHYSEKNATAPSGPIATLEKKFESGDFKADQHQEKVMVALQRVYDAIQSYQPREPQGKSFLSSLFSRKATSKGNATNSDAPKGLYIHGSVGGGKTTLMDLFYDCCQSVSINVWIEVPFCSCIIHVKRYYRLINENGSISIPS